MPTPARRAGADHCPGALQVHAAADGGLVRVRIPGGVLAASQLSALLALSALHSDGSLELTSRGNVQLRGIAPGAEAALAAGLEAAGLLPSPEHERVRNIVASVLSGRVGGLSDVRSLVLALDRGLCADPALAALSGRFLFTLDDGRGDVVGLGGDVGLLAVGTEYALTLAGADTGLRLPAADAPALLLAAARAFLDERAAQGSAAWRLAELAEGPARVAARLPTTRLRLDCGVPLHNPTARSEPPVGVVPQRDGLAAVAAVVPLGRLKPAHVAALAGCVMRHAESSSAAHHTGEVLVTPWRSVVVPDLPPADVPAVTARLGSVGLVTDPGSPWVGVTACAGRPGCAKALADVRADAAGTAIKPGGRVHWIGCERGCGRPATPHVEVRATTEGYLVNGERPQALADTITAARRSL